MTAQLESEDHQSESTLSESTQSAQGDFDVVVVGAGFAGLYLLHRLRGLGLSAKVFETGDDVGGTWFWNRYPGARCDVQSIDYSYSFDPELEHEWQWSEKYAAQPEILRYVQFVTEKYDLRRDIQFSTRVDQATWDESASLWRVRTDDGAEVSCRFYVMATGCLSLPKAAEIAGTERFAGEVYYTSRWPHDGVDFTGKRVGVIGTGSSGVQSIPIMARQATELVAFQRTPNFSIPALNGAVPEAKLAAITADRAAYRHAAKWSGAGWPATPSEISALLVSDEEREAIYEAAWRLGDLAMSGVFNDTLSNKLANDTLSEFLRNKIRSVVRDPETAEMLAPKTYPYGTKRPCLDTNYYETFNLPHVRLIDLQKTPITTITETGIETSDESFEFDAIVFATGFDAMTGAIVAVDITGRDGVSLKEKWSHGPKTYLGLMIAGFPNLFTVTGPGSPSVLSNMMVSIEQHVDWISDCLVELRTRGFDVIEPTETAETGWVQHVNDFADLTLFPQANSWYMGANVPGKPRVFLPYIGGVDTYRSVCEEVVSRDYLGFDMQGPAGRRSNDGIVRALQPDVAILLDMIAALELPALDSMSPEEARAFSVATSAERPTGPEVGQIVDGVLPGADGDLDYRLYRPSSPGPHPIVAYFHGGGWVLGSHESDDPFCRDLCDRSEAIIISVNYRHAPEARFPAAADDGFAAVQWIAENAESLGGRPGELAVAGWSAGGNIAAVVCQLARDAGGPRISGQMLLTPVTDCDPTTGSYVENAAGYMLTADLMRWFWDHYADPADRTDPKASPIRAASLADLPPALVVTCQFDPLRDEGAAYAMAMSDAGVPVRHVNAHGQIHTSVTAVDMLPSGASVRAEMGAALRGFFEATVSA